jgi:hypothetical protein
MKSLRCGSEFFDDLIIEIVGMNKIYMVVFNHDITHMVIQPYNIQPIITTQ